MVIFHSYVNVYQRVTMHSLLELNPGCAVFCDPFLWAGFCCDYYDGNASSSYLPSALDGFDGSWPPPKMSSMVRFGSLIRFRSSFRFASRNLFSSSCILRRFLSCRSASRYLTQHTNKWRREKRVSYTKQLWGVQFRLVKKKNLEESKHAFRQASDCVSISPAIFSDPPTY